MRRIILPLEYGDTKTGFNGLQARSDNTRVERHKVLASAEIFYALEEKNNNNFFFIVYVLMNRK